LPSKESGKSFNGTIVLNDAEFSAKAGEVHALLSEKRAGKSSLMNVAAGLYAPEAGHVIVNDALVALSGPAETRSCGVGMVHQHFKLVMPFTVAENILLADWTATYRTGIKEVRAAFNK
jgi:general nucleoside transport system ATP-binding protein